MSNRESKKIRKIILGGLFVSVPLVTMAATQVTITDGNPNTAVLCQQTGQVSMAVGANGDVTLTMSSLDCLQGGGGGSTNPDTDGDGYSDTVEEAEGSNPNDANSIPADNDGDKNPDSTDLDDDNDGYPDTVEASEGTDPKNANSKPADLDNDKIPDSTDPDIDGDGYTNTEETAAGSDPRNANSVPVVSTPDSLPREADIVDKFNNAYGPYNSKSGLTSQTLTNGKTVYTVNQGYLATSLASCVNGKDPQNGCGTTGWNVGMKQNEIFAVRNMTKPGYVTASINMSLNQKSFGKVAQADYVYNISDKPGDMTGTPFAGKCKITTSSSSGALFMTPPGKIPYTLFGFYCEVPENTAFYLNVELVSDDYNKCGTGVCSGYFWPNSLQLPNGLIQGAK